MKPSEDNLIEKLKRTGLPGAINRGQIRLGIGDDAALFAPRKGHEIVLTCDWSLEGTHFLRDTHSPDSIGWKCLARAVSDLAAMGAEPKCFLLSLALPASHTGRWLDGFLGGLRRASRKFGCPLVGGDTTRNQQILINVSAVGEVQTGRALLRSGARVGDIIYVSGQLGEAELGLRLLRQRRKGLSNWKQRLLKRHLYPEPRLALGRWLAECKLATAIIDLSDGLSTDLARLCNASGVGARLELLKIPQPDLPSGLSWLPDAITMSLRGGDDYELLFTVAPRNAGRIPRRFRGVRLTPFGVIISGPKIVTVKADGNEQSLLPRGWDPFRT